MALSRRALLGGGGLVALSAAVGGSSRAADSILPPDAPRRSLSLFAAERSHALIPGRAATPHCCAYNDDPAMIVRARQGTLLQVDFENRLPDATTVHWHGVRVPNRFDGAPAITQKLVTPGERFRYEAPLADAGLFFFHAHCDETAQFGRGLFGLLLVEDERDPKFDVDKILVVKDWRLDEDGGWLPMTTEAGASSAGTFGTVRTTNGSVTAPRIEAPAHGDARIRVLIADNSRIIDLGCDTKDAAVIACDGHATAPFRFEALPNETWRMGPAMRLDMHVRMPAAGAEVHIYDYRSAEPFLLATLAAAGTGKPRTPFRVKALPQAAVPMADIAQAERLDMLVQVAAGPTIIAPDLSQDDPLAKILSSAICVGKRTNWSINRTSWSTGEALRLPPPLATMVHGRSYVLSIANATKHVHPMHLHGHVFKVLSSSRNKQMPQHLADTVITEPNETVDIAFRATRGNWLFHCHITEHMDTGMMGWLRVV